MDDETIAAMAAFAAEYAGTEWDHDPELEAAGIEFMLDEGEWDS